MKAPTIILGPPGTGKTTKLLTIVDDLLNRGIEPENIGYVSFTRKAVQEARDRAVAKFKLPTDKFKYFRTMHSLALENSTLNTAKLMDDEKFEEFSKIMGLYVPVKSVEDEETGMKMYNNKYLNIMQNARHRGVPLRTEYNQGGYDFSFTVLQKFVNGYNKFKQAREYFDFTDMIEEYVLRGEDIPLDALFIDEAQDLNFLQLRMKEKLMSNASETYIAGDDDQAIYSWSGVDPKHFIEMKGDVINLKQSYRCAKSIHKVAMKIRDRIGFKRFKTWEPRPEEGKVLRHADLYFVRETAKGNWIMMGRTKNICKRLTSFCREKGYYYATRYGNSVSEKRLVALQTWLDLQQGEVISLAALDKLYFYIAPKDRIERGKKEQLKRYIKENPTAKKEMVNIEKIQSDWGLLVSTEMSWFDLFTNYPYEDKLYLDSLLRRGEDIFSRPRIRIETIHGMKGGEEDNVLLLLDMGKLAHDAYKRGEDDEHRVWYVAVTRARNELHLVDPDSDWGYSI